MNRRHFLASAIAVSLPAVAAENRPPHIILRSSWQTVNIGDIGHTPGMLHLLEQYLPGAKVSLWPSSVDNGVAELLIKRFPKLTIYDAKEGQKRAFAEGDFLLHGSGASLVAEKHVERWWKETGKPFGIAGITFSNTSPKVVPILNAARFVYFRDSVSLKVAKDFGCTCPVQEFGSDGAFAVDLRNEAAAAVFLKAHDLEEGKFLCCIPRLRNTPYWTIKPVKFDEAKNARNEEMKEHDHAPLRDAVIEVVRKTPMKVLLCPEDQTQMKVGKELIYDKLPDDVKAKVVWRENYWLTDEAVSTYIRSAGLFGNEMHSPIMCIGNGIPAIVCRWKEQTTKGLMWRDIGLGEWLFDLDNEDEVKKVAPTVLAMAQDPAAAKAKAVKAGEFVKQRQKAMMETLEKSLAS